MIAMAVAAFTASIGGSILNYKQTKETNQQMMDFSRESAEKQQEYSKELLDYNSPSYQMGRILDAGLNPNLAYDNLDTPVPTGAHADTPQLKAPQIDLGVDDALKVAQINRLNSATDNENEKTQAEIAALYEGNKLKEAQINTLAAQAESLGKSVQEMQARIDLLTAEKKEKLFDLYQKEQLFEPTKQILMNDLKISGIQAENFSKFYAASILLNENQAAYYLSAAKLNHVQEGVAKSLANLYRSQTTAFDQENILRSFDVRTLNGLDENGQQRGINLSMHRLEAKNAKYDTILKQNELLQRFGSKEHIVNLILSGCRAFESVTHGLLNISDAVSTWVPSIREIKSLTTGNVKKTTSTTNHK